MKSLSKRYIAQHGIWIGVLFSVAGVILFSIIEPIIYILVRGAPLSSSLVAIPIILVYCNLIALLPAALGGIVLSLILLNRKQKDNLTMKNGTTTGIILAGITILSICALGISIMMLAPHASYNYLLADIKEGVFFVNLPGYLRYAFELASNLYLEIITALLIACIAGGLAGRFLTKKLIFFQVQ
jgi:hypothetical protein